MKYKLFSLISLLFALTLLPLPALAEFDEVSCGEKNDTVLASIDDKGKVSIRVTGLVTVSQQAELNVEYGADVTSCPYAPEEITNLIFEENVTGVADGVFRGCTQLTKLSLHQEDTATIGAGAFAGCTALADLTLTPGVTAIGDGAFADCTSLTSVTLSDEMTLTTLGTGVFQGCPIQTVTAGESWRQGDKQAQLAVLFPELDPAQIDYYSDGGGVSPLVFVSVGVAVAVVVAINLLKRRGEEDED